ncbi:homoserine kinase [Fulvimarina manganoxydans]|uniref:Homoserine kinase n=1 Tax=Fulvimarina manganoxydans TaxID=937218 RepID=A0A1W2ED59_9HYPH|nr:homoserine kinase [Fulvimarina manganoxydans]MCK5934611.1 homoserine kinase [Fulvimarina manganoxydans]MEE2951106.1 homoserine kinase [Pseudomonadota bacterium]SMD07625.1 homoserine kinase [Fulvimarina manganoxydans]
MAVYTDVPETELAEFLAAYDLGQLLSYKGIAEGVENSNFLLRTGGGTFILTLYEKRVNRDDLPFFLGLMQHLAEHGLSCPLPIQRKDGEALGELAGRPAAVFTFLEGMGARRPTASHCRAVGAAMARLHAIGDGFSMRRANALSIDDWRPLFESCPPKVDTVEEGLSNEIAGELSALERDWPRDLPSGVIHADLFTDNVFFLAGDLSGIIDFYFACNDLLAYDLAIGVCAWCFEADGSFNITKSQSLLRGYQSVRPLEPREIEAFPVLCRGASMRFLLTRLYDWLTVPDDSFVTKKDPKEYLRKLRFHAQVSGPAEYGFAIEGDPA